MYICKYFPHPQTQTQSHAYTVKPSQTDRQTDRHFMLCAHTLKHRITIKYIPKNAQVLENMYFLAPVGAACLFLAGCLLEGPTVSTH